jgi:hypothetical protein
MSHDKVLPQLDAFEKIRWNAEVEQQRDLNATNQFLAEHPQYFNSDANGATMLGWLRFQRAPVSLKNLSVAFRVLSAERKLETFPVQQTEPKTVTEKWEPKRMGVKDTAVLTYRAEDTPLNRELLKRDYAARYALCPLGANPKKTELGAMHRKSLQDERGSKDNAAYLEARQQAILQNPRLRRDSAEMNRKTVEILDSSLQ